jgi:N-acetylglucosamine malate deacetylase 1
MTIRDYIRAAYRNVLPLLYARQNFKLFLKTTVENCDARLLQLASLTDYFSNFVRPVPIRAPFGDSMLVVAPHQDDETIGCGGALALQVRAKRPAFIVLVQDGADGHDEIGMTRPDLVALRNEESRRAAVLLGIEPPRFLGHANLIDGAAQAAEELREIIVDRKVDVIFAPFLLDGHPDHRTTCYILADALTKIDRPVRVLGYEVWGLCIPNVVVVIDAVIQQKLDMLACFEFANKALDYVQSTKGLNMYRSRLLGSGQCKYAECFFEVPRQEYIRLVDHVQATERRQPTGEASTCAPLSSS